MKQLERIITRKGFTYTQIEQTDEKAIYCQEDEDGLAGHEIFYIRKEPDKMMFDKLVEAHEGYPGDNDFGVTAWSVGRDLERAMRKYYELQPIQHKVA